jgi:hypothetical protein
MRLSHNGYLELILRAQRNASHRGGRLRSRLFANIGIRISLTNLTFELNHGCSRSSQCCVTGMPLQSLSSKWHAAKARRGRMFLCDLRPRSNAGAGPFSTQPSGPRFLGRIFASLPRPAPNAFGAGASLAPPNSPKLLVAIVKPYRLHNTKY